MKGYSTYSIKWKSIAFCFVALAAALVQGAVPQLQDFNTNQFQTTGGIVGVKSGASLTNTALVGSPTLNGVAVPYGGANYVVYGATNSTLPNSRVLSAGSNVTITESGTNLTVIAASGGGTNNGLPDPGGNGIVIRTMTNTTAFQSVVGVAGQTTVTNGDGTVGPITIGLPDSIFTTMSSGAISNLVGTAPIVVSGSNISANANLTALSAYGPTAWQITNVNLTLFAGYLPSAFQATNSNLTLLGAYGPASWQATNANLTALSPYGPTSWQITNTTLTLLAGYGPAAYQKTNANLTLLQAYTPVAWQATNATLTDLSTNSTTGAGRIVLETTVAGPFAATNAPYLLWGTTNSSLSQGVVLAAGSGITLTSGSTNITIASPGGTVTNVPTTAALEALSVPDGTPVVLQGYYAAHDMPSVLYTFVAGDTSIVDNGSVITNAAGRFKLQPQGGRVDIRTFGAIADYSGEVDAVWTNTTTGLTLAAPLGRDYTGKVVAVRRGNTSVDASLYPLVDVGGIVTNWVIVNPGQGYINVPTLTKSSGPGSGGTFTINLTAGQVSSVTIGAGGTLYTTNTSIFSVVSTDLGLSTNAPYMSEKFTVSVQSGTAITLSGIPSFAMPLNPNDNLGKAIFYTDNATAIQNALNYATNAGVEVVIPAGTFATGPCYVNQGQKIIGLDREKSKLVFTQGNTFTTYRRSVLTANDVNFVNGRQAYDSTLKEVYISNFTIDGNGQFQNPMGANLANGSFALMGINVIAGERWTIDRMTITNCQGDGIYLGSFTPTIGIGGNYDAIRSTDIYVHDSYLAGNWRHATQIGNAQNFNWSNFRFKDNAVGILEVVTRRGNPKGTYSDEEIDMEANDLAIGGYAHFTHGEISTDNGEGINQSADQRLTYLEDVTFKNIKGNYFAQPGFIGEGNALNQEILGEWTTINNCRFIATATNYAYPFLLLRFRGTRVIGSYFEGNGSVLVDYTIGNQPHAYEMTGVVFSHNQFNLYPLAGATSPGIISVTTVSHSLHRFVWDDSNIIIAGLTDIREAARDSDSTLASSSGLFSDEGYVYQAGGGAAVNFWSEQSPAGLGAQDFTIILKLAKSYADANCELFRLTYGSVNELIVSDRTSIAGKTLDISWNPTNIGATTITVPRGTTLDRFGSWQATSYLKPINLSLVRKIGSVWSIQVVDQGTNYATVPTVSLTGFGGSGATATAQISGGHITNIYVLNPGTGFTTNFQVNITSASGSNAVAIASVGRLQVYSDDQLIYTDTSTNISHAFTTGQIYAQFLINGGNGNDRLYSYAMWNYALAEMDIRRFLISGVEPAHRWGTWGSTAGCLTYTKFNSGIGYFFPDLSPNGMNVWGVQDATVHAIPKTSGQIRKRIVTGGSATTSFTWANSNAIPAHARITGVLARPVAGTPSVVVGFNSTLTAALTPATVLVAATTNYLPLIPDYAYGSTNRPLYASQNAASTVDYIINYSLDQGGLDGSTIQSGIVTAPGGLGSTSAIAATAIDATGWTNTFGVNAMIYAEGTGLQFTVYNAAGTPVYTNAATVGSASIALQKGAKMIVIAGTGVSGRAVPW